MFKVLDGGFDISFIILQTKFRYADM